MDPKTPRPQDPKTPRPVMHIKTGIPEFDNLIPMVRGFLEKDLLELFIDGQRIRGYRSPDSRAVWIRDYSDMMRAFRYFEKDLQSTVRHFADTQSASGRIFDYFTTFPEKIPCERENWTKYVRVPVEADVEYRFIKAAWLAWQASGDDDFIRQLLPVFRKALDYVMESWYFDRDRFLFRRPYTIDTWDFAYTAGRHNWLQFSIDDNTFWGYMHGDSSGYFEAFRIMSGLYSYFGDNQAAEHWKSMSEKLRDSLNSVCWNGSWYTHFVKITPVSIPGIDESYQLSLSNPMNINRGVTNRDMAASIIKEYRKRKFESGSFAEWFSIHPPFPDGTFGDEKLVAGAYCNGGIMPLVGGELAMAALNSGFEEYGISILKQYYNLISGKGETFLWYFPDGSPSTVETSTSPEAMPTDGWGSGAMLWALVEGLAGIRDNLKEFRNIRLSPRWEAAGVNKAEVRIEYPASGARAGYRYNRTESEILLEIEGNPETVEIELLVPEGKAVVSAVAGGADIIDTKKSRDDNKYFNCTMKKCQLQCTFTLKFHKGPA